MESSLLLAAKSVHIIFVVAWFAALFYMPRLLIYELEARERAGEHSAAIIAQLALMQHRLWYIISWPSAILVVLSGAAMLLLVPAYLAMPWMHLKLGFVALLLAYHLSIGVFYARLRRDKMVMSSQAMRFYNEIATLLLFAIVFTVVFKNTMSWIYGAGGLLLLAVLLSVGIMLYKKSRKKP